jgi:hypothetical protein
MTPSRSGTRLVRRGERGAAVFIVVMVITLLTAIGVFAARSASLVDMATGYDRQATQARLVSEYAGRLTASELGTGSARAYLDRFTAGIDRCASNMNVTLTRTGSPIPCKVLSADDLTTLVQQRFTGQTLFGAQSTTAGGSLGPQLATATSTGSEGIVRVEIIDAFSGETAPGSPANGGFMDVQFTLTAYAQVRNATGSTAWCGSSASSTSASVQSLRAHVTVPNVAR